jgi:hypothetical protein
MPRRAAGNENRVQLLGVFKRAACPPAHLAGPAAELVGRGRGRRRLVGLLPPPLLAQVAHEVEEGAASGAVRAAR